MKMKSEIQLGLIDNEFVFVDSIDSALMNRKVQRTLKKFNSYFSDFNNYVLKDSLSHIEIEKLVAELNKSLIKASKSEVLMDDNIKNFISRNAYAINEQRIAGLTIKENDERWQKELSDFNNILNQEITRPLKPIQVRASFYLTTMKRAANFSVPGAGKTAMMYGTYAYLSSDVQCKVDKLLVMCLFNAFEAWRSELIEVFKVTRT